ncbi:MAG TPA: GNAT family N-acetyltransferase [Solirubrobacteraceae bacterium]
MPPRIVHGDATRLPELEPLWEGLHAHHARLRPPGVPVREVGNSWSLRRTRYERWLADGQNVLLLAEADGVVVGYAMVTIAEGDMATWDVGPPVAELETLAVLPEARGAGVGTALTDAAAAAARDRGARSLLVSVLHTNADAIRFYEREDFEPFYVQHLRQL